MSTQVNAVKCGIHNLPLQICVLYCQEKKNFLDDVYSTVINIHQNSGKSVNLSNNFGLSSLYNAAKKV